MFVKVAYYIQPTLHLWDLHRFIDIGLQKFVISFVFITAEDNKSRLRGAHLRDAGYEYISERHVGINYK